MTRILFLDYDGVLVLFEDVKKKKRPASATLSCIAALNRIVAETGALVVVTSAWRITNSVDALSKCMADWGFVGRVLDATPHLDGKRAIEICSWLMKFDAFNDYRPRFVILDDEVHDLWMLKESVIKCDSMKGLTENDADRAIAILSV